MGLQVGPLRLRSHGVRHHVERRVLLPLRPM